MFVRLAVRNLFRNRRRSLITIASVFFAVFFALLMRSLQYGVYDNMIDNIVGYYTGYAQIQSEDYWTDRSIDDALTLSPELRQTLEDQSGVAGIVPRLESFALASAADATKGVMVTGVDIDAERAVLDLETKLVEGDYFTANRADEVIVGEKLADFFDLGIGDTLVLLGLGYRGASAAGKFVLRGTVRYGSPELSSGLVCLPIEAAQTMYNAPDLYTSLIVQPDSPRRTESMVAALQSQMPDGYVVKSWKSILPELVQLIEADNVVGYIALTILYLIIGFGMFGTILMMATERLYEFGVLISIGMQRRRLIAVQVFEGILLAMSGVVAGVVFSFPILLYLHFNPIHLGNDLSDFAERYDVEPVLNFSLDPEIFWVQAVYVFVIAVLVNWYPVWKIGRLSVIQALRK